MSKNYTEIYFILDRTGSMGRVKDEVISGFNAFIKDQSNGPDECLLTLIQFDSQDPQEVVYAGSKVEDVKELTDSSYQPRSMTPLYDAVGMAIINLGNVLEKKPEEERPSKVVFVILTDGYENASKEYSQNRVRDMIKHQREKYSWQFIFLGVDIEAEKTAGEIGIEENTSASIGLSARHVGLLDTSHKLRSYRISEKSEDLIFSDSEKKELKGE